MLGLATIAFALASLRGVEAATPFQLVQNHQGSNFLNNWSFYSGLDTNNTGSIIYQSQEQAQQEQLAFLNSAGNYILKVDNTTDGRNDSSYGRATVKLLTSYTISSGNLVLFDAVHLPYGCSVWPAFWSQGPAWPDDGEIDIFEGVNMQTQNDISLHTLNGCTHPSANLSNGIETGQLISTDCFNQTEFNQGCIVQVPGSSYGASFAQNGGGVYALNWNASGIFVWFFPRGSVPSDLSTDFPNPDGWGLPTAAYPTSSCDVSKYFSPQTLILDITICGNFAGQPGVFAQTCSGNCVDLVQTPSNYDNAYFEISYIKVFEQTNGTVSTSATGASSSTSGAGTATTASPNGSNSGTVGLPVFSIPSLLASFIVTLSGLYFFVQ
ncbi:concanavalin A-like lectin/glucanase domain-containing protein [Phellopilus nigrolimitatus]|nr:concanavalin A-like lectin/glucanase domain-containing protein [Phellopilus nigrolimitatus]